MAEKSLELIKKPSAYRRHINEIFPNGITALPTGDSYIVHVSRQIKRLGECKKGMTSPLEKQYYEMRQENLRSGIKAYKLLQKKALSKMLNGK
jgi:hypothetical protein